MYGWGSLSSEKWICAERILREETSSIGRNNSHHRPRTPMSKFYAIDFFSPALSSGNVNILILPSFFMY